MLDISIVFDVIFIVQHHILYKGNKVKEDGMVWERRSLIANDDDEAVAR